jgi:hypothetical protein
VSQRLALPQHSCETLCPTCAYPVAAEIEVNQRSALYHHSCQPFCPGIADVIGFSKALDMSTLAGGSAFLGSSQGGTYVGATLTAGSGGVYRLGTGGSTLTINTFLTLTVSTSIGNFTRFLLVTHDGRFVTRSRNAGQTQDLNRDRRTRRGHFTAQFVTHRTNTAILEAAQDDAQGRIRRHAPFPYRVRHVRIDVPIQVA